MEATKARLVKILYKSQQCQLCSGSIPGAECHSSHPGCEKSRLDCLDAEINEILAACESYYKQGGAPS